MTIPSGIDVTTVRCAVDGCPEYATRWTKDGRAQCHEHWTAEFLERSAQRTRTRNRIAHIRRRQGTTP
jgi:hypothetical protein